MEANQEKQFAITAECGNKQEWTPMYSRWRHGGWYVDNRKWADAVKAIQADERFAFAGGQCLAADVDLIYLGPGDENYSPRLAIFSNA